MRNQFLTVTMPIGLAVVAASAIVSHGQNSRYTGVPILGPSDARTPIFENDLPLMIDEPGSYYVAENIMTGECGITIASDNVTIDLNGFTLGRNTVWVCDGPAITSDGDRNNIRICNGMIVGWVGDGIALEGTNHVVENVIAEGNRGDGIRVGEGSLVKCCVANRNSADGISTEDGGTVIECIARNNAGDGISAEHEGVVASCVAGGNGRFGIYVIDGGVVTGCAASENVEVGIRTGGAAVSASVSNANGLEGFLAFRSVVSFCSAGDNESSGYRVFDGTTVFGCTSATNDGHGFSLGPDACRLRESSAFMSNHDGEGNAYGISVGGMYGVVEGNSVYGFNDPLITPGTIILQGDSNLAIRNVCLGIVSAFGTQFTGVEATTEAELRDAVNATVQFIMPSP